jgi:hypothetical protein
MHAPPWLTAPTPRSQGRGGSSRDETRQPRWSTTPSACTSSPLLSASPLSWGRWCKARCGAGGHLPPPASPATGVAIRVCRPARLTLYLAGSCPVSRPAPSWASIVKEAAHANLLPDVSRRDFLAFYERCIVSGLRTRIVSCRQLAVTRFLSPAA